MWDEGMSLVMPFVVCTSQGGPYDDAAFVAGVRMQQIDAILAAGPADCGWVYRVAVEPTLAPQLDLVAMQHGYAMTHEPWEPHPDEWVLATFTRVKASDG